MLLNAERLAHAKPGIRVINAARGALVDEQALFDAAAALGGVVFDATGSYAPLWTVSIALGVVAALLHWPIDDRTLARAAA